VRVAVIADVHGNRLALAVVLAAVKRASPDLLVELGDAVSGPLWPEDCFDMLAQCGAAASLRGNHDRWVAFDAPDTLGATDRFTHARLSDSQREALGARPMSWRADGILAMHALPEDDMSYVMHESTEHGIRERRPAEVAALLPAPDGETLVLTAHTHRARLMRLPDGRCVVNPGSVGQPAYKDTNPFFHRMETGTPHARWALADRQADGWRVAFHAEDYDWDAASAEALRNGRADWSQSLATGTMD